MDKKINHLGSLQGRILLFGGVYSNLQALEALIAKAEALGIPPTNCISTGDLVGYCAQPEETISRFIEWGAHSIAGNVELQLREGADDCGCDFRAGSRCDTFSQLWYPYAQSKLSKASINFLSTLPDHIEFQFLNKKIHVLHGSYQQVSEFIFKSTPWSIKQASFDATESQVIIAGHCGLPFHHEQEDLLWLNPGVLGMPANDGSPQVWYAVLDDHSRHLFFKHHTLDYDYRTTSALMHEQPLPPEYARTIITGIWDNTEILPDVEKGLQGFGIKL
ncbi:metallophosphoesterase family protein [Croceiramulus getboli]|nr:metallophosphoesterase family protein [Flavobacteriaceae bacterium YJPT1-3]